jgi:hypothetical protein
VTPTPTNLAVGPDLVVGPAQVWGSVRLVPLLRSAPITDLRLHAALRPDNELDVVRVAPRTAYIAFVPHAFVATWTPDGSPAAAFGTQLAPSTDRMYPECVSLRFEPKMARRTDPGRLRFLPLHLAMDGYLALHFGGPTVAWAEWSAQALRHGLSPRVEAAYSGAVVPGLRDALRIFEILPDQCGMLLYVADALASAFVVGHPDDYRAMHPTLVQDMYGELIWQYGSMYDGVQEFRVRLDDAGITSLADLRAAVARAGDDWRTFHTVMSAGLFGVTPSTVDTVYRMSDYTLSRFLPPFDPLRENHIGEMITDRDGRLAYLKTFRLSAAQARRGHLLAGLAASDWHVDRTAEALGTTRIDLISRIERAGFGYMLRRDVLDGVRAARRRQNRINRNS